MDVSSSHTGATTVGDWIEVELSDGDKMLDAETGEECPTPVSALKVLGDGGVVMCVSAKGRVIPWAVESGDIIPLRANGIRAEGTTATGIYALY